MSFPLAYQFIQGAFDEQKDFYKNPSKSNPLVDDLYTSQLELKKRQRLQQKAVCLLDSLEVTFPQGGDWAPVNKKTANANKTAFTIDSAVDQFNRQSSNRNVVFVHCAMGRSRSATCVIMYIMKRFGIPFEDVSCLANL